MIVIFKLGGSLLDLPDLPLRLAALLAQRPDRRHLLIVGGGPAADIVRNWDRIYRLGDDVAHRLAIQAMTLNAKMLQALMPGAELSGGPEEIGTESVERGLAILDPVAFLNRAKELPSSWDVTSDSIAASAALRWNAEELVLMKSRCLPAACTLADAQHVGLVDRYFSKIAGRLPRIGWVNLRDATPRIERWLGEPKLRKSSQSGDESPHSILAP